MNLTQLRYFTTAAQLQNLSKTAEVLNITQSALSKIIARLETELETPLFERRGKHLELNAAGERFLDCCSVMLREYDLAVEDLTRIRSGDAARLRIGTAATHTQLLEWMARFRRECPDAAFDVVSDIEERDSVDMTDLDVLIYPDERRFAKFEGYLLGEEHYYLAVPAAYPRYRSGVVSLRELSGENMVFLRSKRAGGDFARRACAALALRFRQESLADTPSLHREMIASGLALGFIPESEAPYYAEGGAIRVVPINDPHFHRRLKVCFRREKYLSPLGCRFRDMILRDLAPENGETR